MKCFLKSKVVVNYIEDEHLLLLFLWEFSFMLNWWPLKAMCFMKIKYFSKTLLELFFISQTQTIYGYNYAVSLLDFFMDGYIMNLYVLWKNLVFFKKVFHGIQKNLKPGNTCNQSISNSSSFSVSSFNIFLSFQYFAKSCWTACKLSYLLLNLALVLSKTNPYLFLIWLF